MDRVPGSASRLGGRMGALRIEPDHALAGGATHAGAVPLPPIKATALPPNEATTLTPSPRTLCLRPHLRHLPNRPPAQNEATTPSPARRTRAKPCQTVPNDANARRTLLSAKRTHPPKRQSPAPLLRIFVPSWCNLPPFALRLLQTRPNLPQPAQTCHTTRAGAKRSHSPTALSNSSRGPLGLGGCR